MVKVIQDMPPAGGFARIAAPLRNLPVRGLNGYGVIGVFLAASVIGMSIVGHHNKKKFKSSIEAQLEYSAALKVQSDLYGPPPLNLKPRRVHLATGPDTRVPDFLNSLDLHEKAKWVESMRPTKVVAVEKKDE